MKINKKIIEELVGYLKEFNLSEIEYAEGTTKVKVSRSKNNPGIISTQINKKQSIIENNVTHVTSPIVGTAYLAPEPDAKKEKLAADIKKKYEKDVSKAYGIKEKKDRQAAVAEVRTAAMEEFLDEENGNAWEHP